MEGWQNICISHRSLVNRPVSVTLSLSLCCMIVDKFEENRMLTCIVLWLTSSQDEATAGWVKQMTASALPVSSVTTTLTSSCRTASTEPSLPSRLLHHSARRSPHPCHQSSPLPHHQRKLPLNFLRSATLHYITQCEETICSPESPFISITYQYYHSPSKFFFCPDDMWRFRYVTEPEKLKLCTYVW